MRQGARTSSIVVLVNGSAPVVFNVRYFPVLSRERANELVKEGQALPRQGDRPLLATRQLSEPTRELFRKAGVSWVEQLTGVCRLVGTGLLVEVKTEDISQRRKSPSVRARLRKRSGLIAEVLLLAPQQERIQAGKLVRQTGLSAGLVSRLLHRLASLKLLEINGAGPNRYYQLVDPGGLLDLWAAEEEPPPPPTGLYVWTRSPQGSYSKIRTPGQSQRALGSRWCGGCERVRSHSHGHSRAHSLVRRARSCGTGCARSRWRDCGQRSESAAMAVGTNVSP